MERRKPEGARYFIPKRTLSREARLLLDRVKTNSEPLRVFGLAPAEAEALAMEVVGPLIEGAGLPLAMLHQYRWYVRELVGLMRTRAGPDLSYCMGLCLSRWLASGLEPHTVVFFASLLLDRLQAGTAAVEARRGGGP
ncbi:hypothetical protein FJY71_01595 [candidate division WOR-3 bacterium]|nr:hypothetical protein [candidate division WOR-3 bacterium]